MKTHPFADDEKENIVLSLLRQVGSVHDNCAFVESSPSDLTNNDNPSQAISISFHEINYYIGHEHKRNILACWRSEARKQILTNVSGGFSPGMNAILGKAMSSF